jgi:hypothetical protein
MLLRQRSLIFDGMPVIHYDLFLLNGFRKVYIAEAIPRMVE